MLLTTLMLLTSGISVGTPWTLANDLGNQNISNIAYAPNYGEPLGYKGDETDIDYQVPVDKIWANSDSPTTGIDTSVKYYSFVAQIPLNWAYEDNGSYYNSADTYGYDLRIGFTNSNPNLGATLNYDTFFRIGLNQTNNKLYLYRTHLDNYYRNVYYRIGISSINSPTNIHYFNDRGYEPMGLYGSWSPNILSYDWQYFGAEYDMYERNGIQIKGYFLHVDFVCYNPEMFSNDAIYHNGYTEGYNDAQLTFGSNFNNINLFNLFGAIVDTPFMIMGSLFDYEVFGVAGVTLLSVLATIIVVVLATWVIRRLL